MSQNKSLLVIMSPKGRKLYCRKLSNGLWNFVLKIIVSLLFRIMEYHFMKLFYFHQPFEFPLQISILRYIYQIWMKNKLDISIQIIWIIYLLHEIWRWSYVEQLGFLFADKTILVQYSFKIPLVKKFSKFQHVIRKWPFYFCWQKWRKATIIVSQNCHKQCHKQQISSPFYATKFFREYWIHSLAAL